MSRPFTEARANGLHGIRMINVVEVTQVFGNPQSGKNDVQTGDTNDNLYIFHNFSNYVESHIFRIGPASCTVQHAKRNISPHVPADTAKQATKNFFKSNNGLKPALYFFIVIPYICRSMSIRQSGKSYLRVFCG